MFVLLLPVDEVASAIHGATLHIDEAICRSIRDHKTGISTVLATSDPPLMAQGKRGEARLRNEPLKDKLVPSVGPIKKGNSKRVSGWIHVFSCNGEPDR